MGSSFIVSTGGSCSLCLKSLVGEQIKSQSVLSLRTLFRYLNIDEDNQSLQSNTKSCETCSELFLKFQELFLLRLEIDMKIGVCLQNIRNQLPSINSNTYPLNSSLVKVEDLRKRLKQKCSAKAAAYQPKIVLNDGDRDQTINGHFQIKTTANFSDPVADYSSDYDNQSVSSEPEMKPEVDSVAEVKFDPSSTLNGTAQLETESKPKFKKRRRRAKPTQPKKQLPDIDYKIRPDPSQPGYHLCELCNCSFKSLFYCRTHFRTEHLGLKPKFECHTCKNIFKNASALYIHQSTVHKGIVFDCQHCQKRFTSNKDRIRHELSCSKNPAGDQRPSECKLCGKELPKNELQAHNDKVHASVLKFRCPTCGKRFKVEKALIKHQYTHEKRKRPRCKICSKELSQADALKRHMKVHLGNETFRCDLCGKCFRNKSSLRKHQNLTHLGKRFKCSEPGCEMKYTDRQLLQLHKLRDHQGLFKS